MDHVCRQCCDFVCEVGSGDPLDKSLGDQSSQLTSRLGNCGEAWTDIPCGHGVVPAGNGEFVADMHTAVL